MTFQRGQTFSLRDARDRELGRVEIDRTEGNVVFGRFTPGPDYAQVAPLFAEYVEAANDQLLGVVGELARQIAALGLSLHAPNALPVPGISDVQIGDGIITFRTEPPPVAARSVDVTAPRR
jgi:hypothetical protein